MAEQPLGIAMVICEKVITEAGTNNKTLVSIFNSINGTTFPLRFGMSVYVAMTNGSGDQRVKLKCLVGEGLFFEVPEQKFHIKNPNDVIEFIFNLKTVTFPTAGLY